MTKGRSPLWTAVMVLVIVIIMLLGAFWVIRAVQHSGGDGAAVAVVNNQEISEDQWVAELKKRYGQEILTQMMNRKAVQLEAQTLHIEVSQQEIDDSLQEQISGYDSPAAFYKEMSSQFGLSQQDLQNEATYQIQLEKIATASINVTDEQIDSYLQQHEQQNSQQRQYELAWIKTDSEDQANEAVQRIENGEDFGDVAKQLSIDSFSASNGGELGWIDDDDPFQPAEMMKVVKTMNKGDIVGPIKLDDSGYAVVKMQDIRLPQTSKLEISRDTARRKIALERARPLTEVEQQLRKKYNAYILSANPQE